LSCKEKLQRDWGHKKECNPPRFAVFFDIVRDGSTANKIEQ
jgi:hypothetical protein